MLEQLQIRVHGGSALPTLIYLPGLHGDWTLVSSFRAAVAGQVRFVEFTYPRTVTWSAEDYAVAIEQALLANEIRSGWLLAESFGSQIAWALIGRQKEECRMKNETGAGAGNSSFCLLPSAFSSSGLVLAGGFVKHPLPWGARLMRGLGQRTPMAAHRAIMKGYELYAHFRHRQAPETHASIREFVDRRTLPDRQAMWARLELVATHDPRAIARQTSLPVHYLAGLVDPLVPWPYVRWWLRRNCPGYRGGRTCWRADHNVLSTQPKLAAKTILNWMRSSLAGESGPSSPIGGGALIEGDNIDLVDAGFVAQQ
jgi:pimeloyl-ACP methyl ester carboxylesterase